LWGVAILNQKIPHDSPKENIGVDLGDKKVGPRFDPALGTFWWTVGVSKKSHDPRGMTKIAIGEGGHKKTTPVGSKEKTKESLRINARKFRGGRKGAKRISRGAAGFWGES